MLLRMYLRWAERRGFKTDLIEALSEVPENAPGKDKEKLGMEVLA